jgi:2-polyprenyl-6-hydroxyphenyl methylase / 3-demethylubiquinone-9 3-methyltransferase
MSNATHATVSAQEIDHFNAMAADWWNPDGPSKPLFALNPARLGYIRQQLGQDARSRTPLAGLTILDLGCGGGLVSEPLARMGAKVTAVDAAAANIEVARAHAADMGLGIDYRATTAEALVAEGARFDAVVSLEVVEHVADVPLFLKSCAGLLKPGGRFIFSTLNRSAAAYATVIVAAEYVLRMIPRGTHDWRKFITPDEMRDALQGAGFADVDFAGLTLDISTGRWSVSRNTMINYIGCASIR